MDQFLDFLKIILPASLVLYGMYITFRSFLNKQLDEKVIDQKIENSKIVLPMRLQAYERMCLFLERISPQNQLMRLNDPAHSAKSLQQAMLMEIRQELNHNLSQQVYMSDEAWVTIKTTVENLINIINVSTSKVKEDASGLDLAKTIFHEAEERKFDINETLSFVKEEIRQVF